MVQLIGDKYYIDFIDFKNLLNSKNWILIKGKEGWTFQRHVDSITNLINYNDDIQVQFIIDCEFPNTATKIDVYITNKNQDADFSSNPKHFQFIKTK